MGNKKEQRRSVEDNCKNVNLNYLQKLISNGNAKLKVRVTIRNSFCAVVSEMSAKQIYLITYFKGTGGTIDIQLKKTHAII